MSDTESENERGINGGEDMPPTSENQALPPDASPTNVHSRRDFLRRAGKQAVKEAVDIGSKVVPGGALVRQFVEGTGPRENGAISDDPLALSTEPAPQPTLLKNPLGWFAAWRSGKGRKSDE